MHASPLVSSLVEVCASVHASLLITTLVLLDQGPTLWPHLTLIS